MSIPSLNNNNPYSSQVIKKISKKSKNSDFNKTLRASFKCPIGLKLMNEPLTTTCGHIFDKVNITHHLIQNKICPTCHTYCVEEMLIPARQFKHLIDAWKNSGHGEDTTEESDSESDSIEIIDPSKINGQNTGKKIPWNPASSKANQPQSVMNNSQQQQFPMGSSSSNNNNNQYYQPQQQQKFQPAFNQNSFQREQFLQNEITRLLHTPYSSRMLPSQNTQQQLQPALNQNFSNNNNNNYQYFPSQQHQQLIQPTFNQKNVSENLKRKTDPISDAIVDITPSTKKRRFDLNQINLYNLDTDQLLNNLAQLDRPLDLEIALYKRPEIIYLIDKDGNSLLHLVSKTKQNHMFIEVVINKGGAVDKKNNDGNTPLHLSLENHHLKSSKLLLNAGANKNIENNDKVTQASMILKLSDLAYKFLISKKWKVSGIVNKDSH